MRRAAGPERSHLTVRLAAENGGAGRDGSLEPEREHRKVRLEVFESRIRALEGWRAEKAGEERRLSTVSAGAGGVVAVIVRGLGGG